MNLQYLGFIMDWDILCMFWLDGEIHVKHDHELQLYLHSHISVHVAPCRDPATGLTVEICTLLAQMPIDVEFCHTKNWVKTECGFKLVIILTLGSRYMFFLRPSAKNKVSWFFQGCIFGVIQGMVEHCKNVQTTVCKMWHEPHLFPHCPVTCIQESISFPLDTADTWLW